MLIFDIWKITDTDAVKTDKIKIDPTDSRYISEIKRLFKIEKNNKLYIQPENIEAVHFLTKPKPRGRTPLADDIVVFIHEQAVEHKKSSIQIMVAVQDRFGVEINSNQLKDVLSQKKYTEVPGVDHLREQAKELMPKKPDRRTKITDEMKKEWIRLHVEENMSGNAIAKQYDVSSPSVNVYLRSQFGYRKDKTK